MPFKVLTKKEVDVILDVPYYSEFTEIDGSLSHKDIFKRRSCGIVSIKMVLDYFHRQGHELIKLDDLIKKSLNHRAYILKDGGKTSNAGWVHAGIIRVLQNYGFTAWRRRFFILPVDLKVFQKEGLGIVSKNEYVRQVIGEAFYSLRNSIDAKRPVIVSVTKNLGVKSTPHMVVLTGYKIKDNRIVGFFLNDPNNPKKAKSRPILKNQFISVADFVKIWRKTAIFIEK